MTETSKLLSRPANQALACFALSLLVYGVFVQAVAYGDGVLLQYALSQRVASYHHITYLLSARVFLDVAASFGQDEMRAAFWFSVFVASLGNACLYLLVAERCRPTGARAAILALVATSPGLFFFATTVENPANHYASVCVALLSISWLLRSDREWPCWLAAVPALLVPLSHASGPLFFGVLLALVVTREGREPLFAGWGGERGLVRGLRGVVFVLPALLVWLFDKQVRLLVFGTDQVDQVNPGAGQLAAIFDRGVPLDRLVPFVWHEWFLTAFGLWALWILGMLVLWRRARDLAWIALAAVGPYVVLFAMYQTWERGAYFVPLLPVAAWSLAHAARLRPVPRWWFGVAFALAAAQLVVSKLEIDRHEAQPGAAWHWASDVRAATAEDARPVHVLCEDLFRGMHLVVDHGIDGIVVPPWIEIARSSNAEDPKPDWGKGFAAYCVTHFQGLAAKGTLYLSASLWDALPKLLPELRPAIDAAFERVRVERGAFAGFRLRPR